jgi:hypothetical protein
MRDRGLHDQLQGAALSKPPSSFRRRFQIAALGASSFARDNQRTSPSIAGMITKNLGMLLLAIYLILVGIMGLTGMAIPFVLPIVALLAGIFILLGK